MARAALNFHHSRGHKEVVGSAPREQQAPEALGTFHKAEIEKWWPILKEASIKVE